VWDANSLHQCQKSRRLSLRETPTPTPFTSSYCWLASSPRTENSVVIALFTISVHIRLYFVLFLAIRETPTPTPFTHRTVGVVTDHTNFALFVSLHETPTATSTPLLVLRRKSRRLSLRETPTPTPLLYQYRYSSTYHTVFCVLVPSRDANADSLHQCQKSRRLSLCEMSTPISFASSYCSTSLL